MGRKKKVYEDTIFIKLSDGKVIPLRDYNPSDRAEHRRPKRVNAMGNRK